MWQRDLFDDLKQDEGFVPHAYQDSLGYWTIGYGTLVDQRLGAGITNSEAELLLINRMAGALTWLAACPWWGSLTDNRKRAIANMGFNLGETRFKGFKKMIAALGAGAWNRAADEMLDSRWAMQVEGRAQRLADVMRKG